MQNALALETRPIAEELYALLQSLDPSTWCDDVETVVRERLAVIAGQLRTVLATYESPSSDRRMARLLQRLQELSRLMDEMLAAAAESSASIRAELQAFRRRCYPAYEAVAASLRTEAIHVPSLRPTNYSRNLFHVGSGIGALLAIQFLLTPTLMIAVSGSAAVWAWSMEALRRRHPELNEKLMRVFGPLAHPHEHHRVNSGTWYSTALLILALSCTPLICSLAVIVLAVSDPAAAIIGRRFGRIRLRAGRSLEGTLAFVVAGALASMATLGVFYPGLGMGAALALAFAGSIPGALAELVSQRVDDNFTIPLAVAAGASVASLLLGV